MSLKVALLPGDGIGPEVTEEAVRILKNVAEHSGRTITFSTHRIGGVAIDADGAGLPEATLEACLGADAVLLGAVGHPKFDGRLPAERPEAALLALRERLADILQIDAECVGLQAKTGEGVGPVGREEAIEAQCVALLEAKE